MRDVMNRDKRVIMDKLKLGRSGRSFFIWGAPESVRGPYNTHAEAQVVYEDILNNHTDYEVSGKGIVKK